MADTDVRLYRVPSDPNPADVRLRIVPPIDDVVSAAFLSVDPRFLNVLQWTGHMTVMLMRFGPTMVLQHPDYWREWARSVNTFPAIARLNPPRPEAFDDWSSWARRFNEIVPFLTN